MTDEPQSTPRELHTHPDRYRRLFDQAPVGYLTVNTNGVIQTANATCGELLGINHELLRRPFATFVQNDRRTSFTHFLRRAFEQPERHALEVPLVRPDGTVVHALLQAKADGQECLLTVTDLGVQREAQDHLLRKTRDLEVLAERRAQEARELDEELEAHVKAITYELSVPLRHVRGFAEQWRDGRTAEGTALESPYQRITHAVHSAEHLLDALGLFVRDSRQRMRFTDVDLNRVLREVQKHHQEELEARVVRLTSDELPVVRGDVRSLQGVLDQLLSNALKATRGQEQGRIHVLYQELPDEHVIGVQDNGIGFNMRYKDRLFGAFQRLHRAADFDGAGLGLTLTRRLVLRHGGRVWAEGKPHRGSTFWFALPKAGPQA